ncbi:phosphatidylserine decarboxylase family protein [Planctomycetales bacterium ZRK34]|nr:phosphatidylserine decarboxylase family protein [Planctomycetales bacterium ZRK34]
MLSPYGKPQTTLLGTLGTIAMVVAAYMGWWIVLAALAVAIVALLAFFRDPHRTVPTLRGQAVAPADGRISSIHTIDHYEPFDGPAVCIRIFLSVLDVHINRAALHGRIVSITHVPGKHLNALKAESAEFNESTLLVFHNPTHDVPVCAIRQIAGAIARRIVTRVDVGDILQRGQRFGMIKFGSTTELYLPHPDRVDVQVQQGQYVYAGATVLAMVPSVADIATDAPSDSDAEPAESKSD